MRILMQNIKLKRKTIIVTQSKGINDYIINNENGLIIEKTEQNLYQALDKLKNEEFYNHIGQEARNSFVKGFSKKYEFRNLGEIVRKYVRT